MTPIEALPETQPWLLARHLTRRIFGLLLLTIAGFLFCAGVDLLVTAIAPWPELAHRCQ